MIVLSRMRSREISSENAETIRDYYSCGSGGPRRLQLFVFAATLCYFVPPAHICYVPNICIRFPRSFLSWNETRWEPSRRYCLLSHNWISKYRVSNKLETVKLGKSKIRNRISFVFFSKKSIGWEIELQLNFPRIDKTRSLKESRLP